MLLCCCCFAMQSHSWQEVAPIERVGSALIDWPQHELQHSLQLQGASSLRPRLPTAASRHHLDRLPAGREIQQALSLCMVHSSSETEGNQKI